MLLKFHPIKGVVLAVAAVVVVVLLIQEEKQLVLVLEIILEVTLEVIQRFVNSNLLPNSNSLNSLPNNITIILTIDIIILL
jgi:hypothetical protein